MAERREDIVLLANSFLRQIASKHKPFVKSFAPGTLDLLVKADWPGNVRQLYNVVERLVVLSTSPVVPIHLVNQAIRIEEEETVPLNEARSEFEKEYLTRLLKSTRGNVSRAARLAKRNRTDFYKLMARHNIEPGRFKNVEARA